MKHDNQFKWYEFTLDGGYAVADIRKMLSIIGKKWIFQRERAPETGWEHYQGKVELLTKCGVNSIVETFQRCGFGKGHIERSYSIGDFSYVEKSQTRIDGPWRWDDPEIPHWLADETPCWYNWQKTVIDWEPETRAVNVIIDTIGNTGKSYLSNWLSIRRKACTIPITGGYKDVMRAIYDRPDRPRYFLDLPRATKMESGMISAIESIKNGHVWDDRYKFVERWMEPPVVVVFTNEKPRIETLSIDRWKLWTITGNRELKPVRIFEPRSG